MVAVGTDLSPDAARVVQPPGRGNIKTRLKLRGLDQAEDLFEFIGSMLATNRPHILITLRFLKIEFYQVTICLLLFIPAYSSGIASGSLTQ